MKATLDAALATYQTKLPEDAVQATSTWQPSELAVDTSGRQPLFCAAALRANMAHTNPETDAKKICRGNFTCEI